MTTFNILFSSIALLNFVIAQLPEPNDQVDVTNEPDTSTVPTLSVTAETLASIDSIVVNVTKAVDITTTVNPTTALIPQTIEVIKEPNLLTRVYRIIVMQIKAFVKTPKVSSVLRNIATCCVNGAMELISFYFPAPLIPLIASAAGMLIPFEPVLMLRDKLPVTSYRRAFVTALNSFLGTFDNYKLKDNYEYDPYMTQRFNRRMMTYGSTEKRKD